MSEWKGPMEDIRQACEDFGIDTTKRTMKIGDEVYVHGYVDEIRRDTVIIRNEGGYFGTVKEEVRDGVDAVKVVRCKDCEDWGRSMVVHGRRVCAEWSDFENGRIRLTEGNDFCSYGERREG